MSGYPHNILNQQKRRSFIYNPGANRTATTPTGLEGTSEKYDHSKTCGTSSQPRKKHKSYHAIQRHVYATKGVEELAAEEACRDLPPDAFDDDLECGIEDDDELDDIDDDILTAAEQLDEIERAASLEIGSADHVPNIGNPACVSVQSEGVKPPCTTGRPERSYLAHDNLGSTKTYPSSDRHETSIPTPLQHSSVICTRTGKETGRSSVSNTSGFLNESAPLFSTKSELTSCAGDSRRGNQSGVFHGSVPGDNEIIQVLQKKLEDLTRKCSLAENKAQTLQEQTLGKEGEIKILRDSLEHFHTQEMKRQREKREFEERRARVQSEREKDLEKHLDSLTTRFQFKERELNQMMEQNKKLAAAASGTNDTTTGSPVKKGSKLCEAFPSGNSFFQRTSPQSAKSPKRRPSREGRSPQSKESECSEGKNISEVITSSPFPGISSVRRPVMADSTLEKNLMQFQHNDCLQVELAQKLLAVQDGNRNQLCWTYDMASTDDDSFLSVLKFDSRLLQRLQCEQTSLNTVGNGVWVPQTLSQLLFQGQTPSKVSGEEKDQRQALCGLYTLLSENSLNRNSQDSGLLLPGLSSCLGTAENLLPLVESHIVAYVEERARTSTSDDSLSSTSQSRNSPTPDSDDQREITLAEAEQLERLACLCDVGIKSLRLLNILVLYSSALREMMLNCCSEGQNEAQEGTQPIIEDADRATFMKHPSLPGLAGVNVSTESADALQPDKINSIAQTSAHQDLQTPCELMPCLAKLLVPLQNEPPIVLQVVLQVFQSLSQNCSTEQLTRLLFLLYDGLLSQSMSNDWSLTTLSLVTSILTFLVPCGTNILEELCSQTEDCILLKIYQVLVFVPEDVPMTHIRIVHQQVVALLNNLWSNHESALSFLLETECQCRFEVIRCLVLMLNRELKTISELPVESLSEDADGRSSLALLRTGMFLLIALCTNTRPQSEHRAEVEHQYVSLLNGVTSLYKRIKADTSDAEGLALQDLLDLERIEDIVYWEHEVDEDEDDTAEGMEVES